MRASVPSSCVSLEIGASATVVVLLEHCAVSLQLVRKQMHKGLYPSILSMKEYIFSLCYRCCLENASLFPSTAPLPSSAFFYSVFQQLLLFYLDINLP